MRLFCALMLCISFLGGCSRDDRGSVSTESMVTAKETYKIDFPVGWKVEKVENSLMPGAIVEQASSDDGAVLMVCSSIEAFDYTKHYQNINNDLAMLVADNLYTPLIQSACRNGGLGGRPSITPLNDGKSIQALYVCDDEIVWITTVFGRSNAYMIIASGDKHNKKHADAVMKSRNTFRLVEERL